MEEPVFCSMCLRRNKRNKGESWCNDCCEPNCLVCSKEHQQILNEIHEIVSLQKVQKISTKLENLENYCEFHAENKTTLFCHQHYQFLCNVCLSDQHQNCKSVISSKEAFSDDRIKSKFDKLKDRMEDQMREVKGRHGKFEKVLINAEERKNEIVRRVKEMTSKFISEVKKIEKSIIEDSEIKYEDCKTSAQLSISDLYLNSNTIEKWKNDLQHVTNSPTSFNLFLVIKYFKDKLNFMDISLECSSYFKNMGFQLSKQFQNMEKGLNFGEVFTFNGINVHGLQDLFVRNEMLEDNPPLIGLVSTTKLGDKVAVGGPVCFTHDNKILFSNGHDDKQDELFLCSYDGLCLKKGQLLREVNGLASYDRDIALAATCEGVQIVNIPTLEAGELLLPGTSCNLISCKNGTIVIGHDKDNKIMIILDIKGNVLKTITTYGQDCFSIDRFGDIFSHDLKMDINIFSKNGARRFVCSISYMGGASDMTADDKGNLYVISGWYHNIYKISKKGERQGVVVNNCAALHGLRYNSKTHQLLFVDWDSNLIRIYQLQ